MAKENLRYSDVVRLVQFASWAGTDGHLSKRDAEKLVDEFLVRNGASVEKAKELDLPDDTDDLDLSDLGLDL